ncbi:Cystathionine beta-lyase/cystathionine gamma-synthase [Geosmithia morbida]|uniref:Cystathionine beta-lyase/cystathionine gamma-synthase n=1 Tax=Geosmithia morbida TaxID=1094350 RepID=A0A9P4YWB0_9HYPO|nr:Cystathionine beta-lyase/cystathionine gamma-synthase [Geosmithia morbida]KAF4124035.1 Cystathionine beta-lyase/cystathionine gamma-synthase [Geosmithia morbida]
MPSDRKDTPSGQAGPNIEAVANLSLATRSVHADDHISAHRAVAPAMHVSTTFRYSDDPDQLLGWDNIDPSAPHDSHIYSRDSNPNTTRLEAILTSLLGGRALVYSSGLSAFHAMLVQLNPRRIAIGDGYHGCHGVIDVLSRLSGLEKLPLDCDPSELQAGDVIHVETPLNPTGEARNLDHYARVARERGAYLTVDATFAPPPLQQPFGHGADMVMHSGTKYLGGHSDMLYGVVAVRPGAPGWERGLAADRLVLGSVMGSFEGWLGLRSLRTLELRVRRQSETAAALVAWLAAEAGGDQGGAVASAVRRIQHASLQPEAADDRGWLRRQMPHGFGPVFSVYLKDPDTAKRLPSKLRLFQHATSLGGVESLIEWRAMTDPHVDKTLLRVSIGVESFEDLRDDLKRGFEELTGKVTK